MKLTRLYSLIRITQLKHNAGRVAGCAGFDAVLSLSKHTQKPHSTSASGVSRHTYLILLLLLAACSQLPFGTPAAQDPTAAPPAESGPPTETPLPPPPIQVAEIVFRVTIPPGTPSDGAIELSVLDEVTGLALNPTHYPMQAETPDIYTVTLQFPVGGVIKYRYTRAAEIRAAEHTSAGRPVRYRLFQVTASGSVHDIVSRWNDTEFASPTGRLSGKITDGPDGQPLPNILVSAGGQQVLTRWDGTYLIEGLPPGTHNLVAYALDGRYATFQQGVLIATQATTPAAFSMAPAPLVNVTFYAVAPQDTIPAVPIRLAGNLHQLGNIFADLPGGISTPAARLPVLEYHPEGWYTLTLQLPVGAYLNYKYTLGDGFWNMETSPEGDTILRELIVPDRDVVINDTINHWGSRGGLAPIWFSITTPADTPPTDTVWVQLNPWGWTQPLPMWRAGENRWIYLLSAPLHFVGEVQFRYCRNAQCDTAAEMAPETGRAFTPTTDIIPLEGQVARWAAFDPLPVETPAPRTGINPRAAGFIAGVQLIPAYEPSWLPLSAQYFPEIGAGHANTVLLSPTWTYTRSSPPVFETLPGADAPWQDLVDLAANARSAGLAISLFPSPNFPGDPATWWQDAPRDYAWWTNWFEQYSYFAEHHAGLAQLSSAGTLILGGGWLAPALPDGVMPDGFTSGVPGEAEGWWRGILASVRQTYTGTLGWAIPLSTALTPPPFLDGVNVIVVVWDIPPAESPEASIEQMAEAAGSLIDARLVPLYLRFNKPIVIVAEFPATTAGTLDLDAQARAYEALLETVNACDWLSGFVAAGYYPPASVRDGSTSFHGKPAEALLSQWFAGFLALPGE